MAARRGERERAARFAESLKAGQAIADRATAARNAKRAAKAAAPVLKVPALKAGPKLPGKLGERADAAHAAALAATAHAAKTGTRADALAAEAAHKAAHSAAFDYTYKHKGKTDAAMTRAEEMGTHHVLAGSHAREMADRAHAKESPKEYADLASQRAHKAAQYASDERRRSGGPDYVSASDKSAAAAHLRAAEAHRAVGNKEKAHEHQAQAIARVEGKGATVAESLVGQVRAGVDARTQRAPITDRDRGFMVEAHKAAAGAHDAAAAAHRSAGFGERAASHERQAAENRKAAEHWKTHDPHAAKQAREAVERNATQVKAAEAVQKAAAERNAARAARAQRSADRAASKAATQAADQALRGGPALNPATGSTIKITTRGGHQEVPVIHRQGDFVLHHEPGSKTLTVTHAPTGMGVGSLTRGIRNKTDGKAAVADLNHPEFKRAFDAWSAAPASGKAAAGKNILSTWEKIKVDNIAAGADKQRDGRRRRAAQATP